MTDLQALLNPEIRRFIDAHRDDDVQALALRRPTEAKDWPWPLVLDQIKARQKGRSKIPTWGAAEGLIYPAPGLLEQASSEATALYKAGLVRGDLFADLTAGAGIDTLALLQHFSKGIAVERDADSAAILTHNLEILAPGRCKVLAVDAAKAVEELPPCDLIYVDPQRREEGKKGLFRLEDCSPDIMTLLPTCLAKAGRIMIKTSPVLDIDLAIKLLRFVEAVHVVGWRGDCREVLYLLHAGQEDAPIITPVEIDDHGAVLLQQNFTRDEEQGAVIAFGEPQQYLYEASPAFMKAGCFKILAVRFGLTKLHPHTHLYTGNMLHLDFPGRVFEVLGVHGATQKDLPVTRANLTVRNFPAGADELRKKWKLADGGDNYLFACTLVDDRKAVIHARKVANTA